MSTVGISINTTLDPKALALDRPTSTAPTAPDSRRPRRTQSGRFLKGPIPLGWLAKAAALPGKAMQIAVAIWYRAGMQGRAGISVTNKLAAEFSVDRYAKARAVSALERAGLISVERRVGRSPVVTLLEPRAE